MYGAQSEQNNPADVEWSKLDPKDQKQIRLFMDLQKSARLQHYVTGPHILPPEEIDRLIGIVDGLEKKQRDYEIENERRVAEKTGFVRGLIRNTLNNLDMGETKGQKYGQLKTSLIDINFRRGAI